MDQKFENATFAGGCFWCLQGPFEHQEGVKFTIVGYTGGIIKSPNYQEVSSGKTEHLEAIQITFDPSVISYKELLEVFWRNIDPTDPDGQFADRGSQYRTAIFFHSDEQKKSAELSKRQLGESGKFEKPVVTEIWPGKEFYPAEDYHQYYYKKNPFRYEMYHQGSGRNSFLYRKWRTKKYDE